METAQLKSIEMHGETHSKPTGFNVFLHASPVDLPAPQVVKKTPKVHGMV